MVWANVNPNIPHPRWSQEYEKILGSTKTRKTLIFNGYEEVSYLYKSLFKKINQSCLDKFYMFHNIFFKI